MIKKKIVFNTLISAALLLFLIFKIDLQEMFLLVKQGNLVYFLLAVPIVPIMLLVKAKKWNVFLGCIKAEKNILKIFRIILAGIFYGMLSPGKIGELGRVYYLKESKAKTIPTVIVDKFIDILLLVILSIIAVPIFFKNPFFVTIAVGIGICLFASIIFITNRKVIKFLSRIFRISKRHVNEYRKIMLFLLSHKKALIISSLYGILYYGLNLLLAALILSALKPSIDLTIVWLVPVIILFGNAPITISGLGLREYVAVLSFELFGEPGYLAFSFSIINFCYATVVPGIIGYFVGLTNKEKI